MVMQFWPILWLCYDVFCFIQNFCSCDTHEHVQPGVEPGDVVVVLQQQKHQVFQRHSCDLMMTCEISLTEALCGLTFIIQHLDGRELVIQSPPGMVIEPGNNC